VYYYLSVIPTRIAQGVLQYSTPAIQLTKALAIYGQCVRLMLMQAK